MSSIVLLIYTFTIIFLITLWKRRKFYLLTLKIPGPLGYPLIGMAHKLMKRERILQVIGDIENRYGKTFLSWLGPFPFLVVSEPKLAGQILNSTEFLNKSIIYSAVAEGTGDGLFSCDTPKWNIHRKAINPTFNQKVLINFIPIFNEEVNNFVEELAKINDSEIEISTLLQKLSLNNAARKELYGCFLNFYLFRTFLGTTMGKQMSSFTQSEFDLLHSFQ